jgi:glucan phosphorylase
MCRTPSESSNTCIDLSLEFLMGRALDNAMLNVGQKDAATSKEFFLNLKTNTYTNLQRVLPRWDSAWKTLFNKNTMLR